MAVDSILYHEADHLANAEKSFYPVRIPVSHWQLRHYISTPEPDLLYYASGHDIYCLNTATKKRKHIATLPFEARCTASGYGWVCVGGEDLGHFAAIKLDGSGPRTLDVDSALPIENWRQEGGRRAASVKVERMGEDIVNSISIHRIQDEEAHLDDIVAVLTNNDKTVRMYSLPQNLETMVLDLPFAMNHSTVSPDGQTLVAVGDFGQAYFFQSEIQETPPQIHKPHNRLTSASIDWKLTSVVNLHVPESGSSQGYFTTAWSPNGHLVAVGSEGGYITVFDVNLLAEPDLLDQDAIVAIVPGSRPDFQTSHPGAVRSMMFSPDPWDLLIWAEDQDRVCIGDLRTGLKSRQIIKLDPKAEGLRQIAIEDVAGDEVLALNPSPPPRDVNDLEADFIRRYRQLPDNATAVNYAAEYIEARRRQRQQRQDTATLRAEMNNVRMRERSSADDDPQGLTARELQIYESLRTTRQREEARANGGTPTSVNYTSADMFREDENNRLSASTRRRFPGLSSARPIGEILSSVRDSFPELSRTGAADPRPGSSHGPESQSALTSLSTLQDNVWGSGQRSSSNLVRLSDGSRLPRRRASVVLTPPATNTDSGSTQDSGSSRAQATNAEDDENPWRTIEEHMTLARGPLFESAQRAQAGSPVPAPSRPTEAELQAELQAERARARSLANQRERWRMLNAAERQAATNSPGPGGAERSRLSNFSQAGDILVRRGQMIGRYTGREIGVRTAGLAMSPDGRVLWAACEEGIFEIRIQVKGRFFWPSVDPR